MTGAVAVGGRSSRAFNPAVAVGISLLGISSWSNHLDLSGGELRGRAWSRRIVFNLINPPAQTHADRDRRAALRNTKIARHAQFLQEATEETEVWEKPLRYLSFLPCRNPRLLIGARQHQPMNARGELGFVKVDEQPEG